MTVEEKARQIIKDIKDEQGVNPVRIFKRMAAKEYVNIPGRIKNARGNVRPFFKNHSSV